MVVYKLLILNVDRDFDLLLTMILFYLVTTGKPTISHNMNIRNSCYGKFLPY